MYRILVVEDDPGIAQAVCAHLRQWELEARCVQNFRAVMDEFTAFDPQLVLLDISLPFFNGYHWCTQIRSVSRVPVMFLSSAAENMNIVMAMNMGADDFIAKPFDLDVLTAKVQALLRRTYDFAAASPVLSHRGAVLQTGDQSLLVDGEKLPLSKNEYRILWTLLQDKGTIVRLCGRPTASSMRTRCRSTWRACAKSSTARGWRASSRQKSVRAIW